MRYIVGLAFAAVLSTFLPSDCEASFVNDFTGNSGFTTNVKGIGGWVNFAVYENPAGSNWVTDLFSGASLVAGSSTTGLERNVFFYEIVRDSSAASETLTSVTIPQGGSSWTGIGAFVDRVFSSGGAVVSGGNTTIGPPAAAGTTDVTGVLDSPPPFASATALAPSGLGVFPAFAISGTTGAGTFSFVLDGLDELEHSSILFLTSHSNPLVSSFLTGGSAAVSGGTDNPNFDVPVSNPEPGSLILLSIAGFGGLGLTWRRRRKGQQRDGEATQA